MIFFKITILVVKIIPIDIIKTFITSIKVLKTPLITDVLYKIEKIITEIIPIGRSRAYLKDL